MENRLSALAVVLAAVCYVLLFNTSAGFELRAMGHPRKLHGGRALAEVRGFLGGVVADEPQDSGLDINAEGAMVKADSARPKPAHALELKRGVTRITFEKAVLLIRQALDCRR